MRLVLSTLMMIAGLACGTHGQPSKEKPMSVSERFAILSEQWAEHCRKTSHSSKIEDYLNDTSFRGLVELGPPAVPLIMEHYATDELRPGNSSWKRSPRSSSSRTETRSSGARSSKNAWIGGRRKRPRRNDTGRVARARSPSPVGRAVAPPPDGAAE